MDRLDRLDRMIAETLAEDDAPPPPEPGFFVQALGLLRGPTAWVNVVLLAVQTVMFLVAVWAGWQFYAAADVLAAVKWGISAAVLAIMALQLKMALVPRIEANRILRALRLIELRAGERHQ